MNEIFILFGNPLQRKKWKANCYEALFKKYNKRIKFIQNEKNKEGIKIYQQSLSKVEMLSGI